MRPPICDKTVPPHLENPGSATVDKMDKLQLTEEETEELLKQAYSINRKLKQQMRDTDKGSTFPASAKSQVLPPIGHGTKHSGTVSAHNRRQHSVGKLLSFMTPTLFLKHIVVV